MKFKKWLEQEDANIDLYNYPEEAMEMAWNAAIDAAESAVDNCDYNFDDSGISANANAMMAVSKLKDA